MKISWYAWYLIASHGSPENNWMWFISLHYVHNVHLYKLAVILYLDLQLYAVKLCTTLCYMSKFCADCLFKFFSEWYTWIIFSSLCIISEELYDNVCFNEYFSLKNVLLVSTLLFQKNIISFAGPFRVSEGILLGIGKRFWLGGWVVG